MDYREGILSLLNEYRISKFDRLEDLHDNKKIPFIIVEYIPKYYKKNLELEPEDNEYINNLKKFIENQGIILVPSVCIKNKFEKYLGERYDNILILYPISDIDNEVYSKKLSRVYIENKLCISEKFILLSGFNHEYFNILGFSKYLYSNEVIGIIILEDYVTNKERYAEILKRIDELGLQEKIVILSKIDKNDRINLINAAVLVVNLNNSDRVDNNLIKAMYMNTKVLCIGTEFNYELFEDYPTYYQDSISFEQAIDNEKKDCEYKEVIVEKFEKKRNMNRLYEWMKGDLYELGEEWKIFNIYK